MFDEVAANDPLLLSRLQAGNEASFAAIVIAWSPAMIAMAERFVTSREAAEDAVQNTWLAVVVGLDGFEGRSGLRTWVLSILIRQAQQLGRRERRAIPFSAAWHKERGPTLDPTRFRPADDSEFPGGWVSPLPRWDSVPERQLQSAELWEVLSNAINHLPRRQQQVIMARDVWGCGAGEVCAMLQLSGNYQRVLLHRARAQLRIAVERYLTEAAP